MSDKVETIDKLSRSKTDLISAKFGIEGIKYFIEDRELKRAEVEWLRDKGVITLQEYSSAIFICPECGSPVFSIIICCPKCKSHDVEIVEIWLHQTCGFVGISKEFMKEGKLVCKVCKKDVKESEIVRLGKSFQCMTCGARFEIPLMIFNCSNCGKKLDVYQCKIEKVPLYKIDRAVLAKTADMVLIETIVDYFKWLESLGIGKLEDTVEVKGLSGIKHKLTNVFRISNNTIIVPIIVDTPETLYYISTLLLDVPNIEVLAICRGMSICSNFTFKERVRIVNYSSITNAMNELKKIVNEIVSLPTGQPTTSEGVGKSFGSK